VPRSQRRAFKQVKPVGGLLAWCGGELTSRVNALSADLGSWAQIAASHVTALGHMHTHTHTCVHAHPPTHPPTLSVVASTMPVSAATLFPDRSSTSTLLLCCSARARCADPTSFNAALPSRSSLSCGRGGELGRERGRGWDQRGNAHLCPRHSILPGVQHAQEISK